jgi:hypothetical protein
MSIRYTIWDKISPINTPSGEQFSADYMLSKNVWAQNPDIYAIVQTGVFNGGVFMELSATVEHYKVRNSSLSEEYRIEWPDGLTPQQNLDKIEEVEDAEKEAQKNYISPEERQVAIAEFQALLSIPDTTTVV